MKYSLIATFFVAVILMSCEQPCEKGYYTESPEIDVAKNLIELYRSGDLDAMTASYTDTSRIYRNAAPADNPGLTPEEYVADLKGGLEPISDYTFDDMVWEMIVTEEGNKWVHLWGLWKGTLEATGDTFDIPVMISYLVTDGKVIWQSELFNSADLALALRELQEAAEAEMVEEEAPAE